MPKVLLPVLKDERPSRLERFQDRDDINLVRAGPRLHARSVPICRVLRTFDRPVNSTSLSVYVPLLYVDRICGKSVVPSNVYRGIVADLCPDTKRTWSSWTLAAKSRRSCCPKLSVVSKTSCTYTWAAKTRRTPAGNYAFMYITR